ncbi:unnamed protein product [Chondrus crispus]|uniref:Uncharacterized protein n=1 Tax=Chondrus crispus TaxID=2769 RepID=R7QAW2_CHOCR|nr:unnamed protein product [Chondrus crispus]CDF35214.1 unnamed protein product [Chondrus crispus]|eukprot:XP_005715033.1 unnamed protein product [Chondrus crispus]
MTVQTFTNVGNRRDLLSIVQLDADVGSAVLGSNYLGSAMPHHIRNLSFKRRALVNVKDVRAQDTLKWMLAASLVRSSDWMFSHCEYADADPDVKSPFLEVGEQSSRACSPRGCRQNGRF